uniref:Desulfoferrodoxin ferrous iron-binding domain-containing protein n=1 Tax=Rhizochromulina marina TaxID=1034831 RepID=A0A7S2S515_9STRA|eukprot:CAMPEP_0118963510 /NCGR_PEP_ID=MMETSP1173-20130426/1373_1 /TAXON_ID=1034831 /ORGANISM="Rhizochromulina marina cf, Strain CCMP1243" /LENGTH=121 /DNA_ID=CAMNT_0006911843 /DNA_START=50 /DNA_END=415 /DNA_ORIENTATION=+
MASEDVKTEVAEVEGSTTILTKEAPGDWAGKEGKHIPVLAVEGDKATVTVPHGMAGDHWIQFIWAKNQEGEVIAAVKLTPEDQPTLAFDVPAGTASITAFESCNLHGVWSSDATALAPASL